MSNYDDFVNDCRHELERHAQRLKTDEAYLWGYLASWFDECNWPDGMSDEEKLAVLEYLLHTTNVTGHIMAIQEAIRKLKERGARKHDPWDDDEFGVVVEQFTAAVEQISHKFCCACC